MGVFRRMGRLDSSLTMRFLLPIIGENVLTVAVGLVFSALVSGVSPSALAALGMANTMVAVLYGLFSVVIVGAAVLVARRIGEEDALGAADVIEQASILTLSVSSVLAVVLYATAPACMRLIMPTAEDALFFESVQSYRALLLSLPAYILYVVLGGVFRSLEDSRTPLLAAIVMNVLQLAACWLFLLVLGWKEVGAGLAYGVGRLSGAGVFVFVLLKKQVRVRVRLLHLLRPHWETLKRLLQIGLPISIETTFVQLGYLVANSMVVALGTYAVGVYQIANTLNTFVCLPHAISAAVAMTSVGHLLGAQMEKQARRAGTMVWMMGMITTAVLGLAIFCGGERLTALYSQDPSVIKDSAALLWIVWVVAFLGESINTVDSQLRAGGDSRFVMVVTLLSVWGLRLPLTWLFCNKLHMGGLGVFMANGVNLFVRAVAGLIRSRGKRWIRLHI